MTALPRRSTIDIWISARSVRDELAGRAEERAARARTHASVAREQAEQDAVRGDRGWELMHRHEAELRERAAARETEAAECHRVDASV